MKSLEDMIRTAAARGELSHLSIGHSPRGVFTVSYRGASAGHYHHSEDEDPIKALKNALVLKKSKPEPDFG